MKIRIIVFTSIFLSLSFIECFLGTSEALAFRKSAALHYSRLKQEKAAEAEVKEKTVEERKRESTHFLEAVQNGDVRAAEEALNKGADINVEGEKGSALIMALEGRNTALVELLIEKGADVNLKGKSAKSPLMLALSLQQIKVAQQLIEKGAHVNEPGAKGDTPLHEAARQNNLEMVKFLLQKGADRDAKNDTNEIAADLALEENKNLLTVQRVKTVS